MYSIETEGLYQGLNYMFRLSIKKGGEKHDKS